MRFSSSSIARSLAGAFLFVAASAAPSAAAPIPSSSHAECITGSAIGCQQVDFFFTLLSGSSTNIDGFTISLLGSGWFFSALQGGEAADANGDNFFVGAVSEGGLKLTGTFFPGFEALLDPALDPTLRLRGEFDHEPDAFGSTASLAYSYSLTSGGEIVATGEVGPTDVVPEPVSMVLLGTGLAGVAAARRRRRTAVDAPA
jgi:hypothetical protein